MSDARIYDEDISDKPQNENNGRSKKRIGLTVPIPNLEGSEMAINDISYTKLLHSNDRSSDFMGELFPNSNHIQTGAQEFASHHINNQYSGLDSEILFSPTSSSSQKNVVTPTLKIDCHEDVWQEMFPTSYVNGQDLEDTSNQQDKQYLSAFTPIRYHNDPCKSDTESDYGSSVYHTPSMNPADPAISPAMSYLTTGDDEIDDLLSVHSEVSATSNISLPLNSGGLKHITNLGDLDNLLTVAHADFTELDEFMQTPIQSDFQDQQFALPPVISIQEVQEQEQRNGTYFNQSNMQSSSSNMPIKVEDHEEMHDNSVLRPENLGDPSYEERRHGRIKKRRTSSATRHSSRSSIRSPSRSVSPYENARAISGDSEKLLELANIQDQPHKDYLAENNNSFTPSSPPDDNDILQNISGETKKKMGQKITAAYACDLCGKRFTRPYNLKSHLRTHTNEKPFICTICGKAFARQHDKKRHEDLHTGKKRYICGGNLKDGSPWGCGKKFARSDALGRHFKTESGRKCIAPLYAEAAREKSMP